MHISHAIEAHLEADGLVLCSAPITTFFSYPIHGQIGHKPLLTQSEEG